MCMLKQLFADLCGAFRAGYIDTTPYVKFTNDMNVIRTMYKLY